MPVGRRPRVTNGFYMLTKFKAAAPKYILSFHGWRKHYCFSFGGRTSMISRKVLNYEKQFLGTYQWWCFSSVASFSDQARPQRWRKLPNSTG